MSDCSICLECIGENIDIKLTECCHTFHLNCFETWVKINNSCPLCRTVFTTIPIINDTAAYVPIDFWFNRDTRLAIPQVSIPYEQTSIDVNVNNYTFSIEPVIPQPSGRQNRSRIEDTRLTFYNAPFALHPESNEPSGSVNFNRINTR